MTVNISVRNSAILFHNPCTWSPCINRIPGNLYSQSFYCPLKEKLKQITAWDLAYRLSSLVVPWETICSPAFPDGGSPVKPFRMAFGALIIKERLNFSGEELVEQIRENMYLQCFLAISLKYIVFKLFSVFQLWFIYANASQLRWLEKLTKFWFLVCLMMRHQSPMVNHLRQRFHLSANSAAEELASTKIDNNKG